MIELGSVSEIVSGFNVARLPINEDGHYAFICAAVKADKNRTTAVG